MATHSSILAWRIPRTEKPGGPRGHKELNTTERAHAYARVHTHTHAHTHTHTKNQPRDRSTMVLKTDKR